MKLFIAQIILANLLIAAAATNPLIEISKNSENPKIASFVREIVQDLVGKSISTCDVTLLRLKSNAKTREAVDEVFDELIRQMPRDIAVTIPDIRKVDHGKEKKSSAIVIVSDVYGTVRNYSTLLIFNTATQS